MALRNYLYAKHIVDEETTARINMVDPSSSTDSAHRMRKAHRRAAKVVHRTNPEKKKQDEECNSGRELVLEDGSKQCRNCPDCPKKLQNESSTPKTTPEFFDAQSDFEFAKVAVEVQDSKPKELESEFAHLNLNQQNEIDFTNAY